MAKNNMIELIEEIKKLIDRYGEGQEQKITISVEDVLFKIKVMQGNYVVKRFWSTVEDGEIVTIDNPKIK